MNEVPVRLLRETLQARGPAGPSQECLDAETVAAWADDTLGRDERRAAEAHAADCGWCQALVAAMAKTAPPAAARSWWRAPAMGWLVPLTAAAAALLVWMSVPGTPRHACRARSLSRAIDQEPARPAESGLRTRRHGNAPPASARQERGEGERPGGAQERRATTRQSADRPPDRTRIERPAAAGQGACGGCRRRRRGQPNRHIAASAASRRRRAHRPQPQPAAADCAPRPHRP